ncbi:hypothetical protein PLICRDRAFT_173852 [Plicaturopsis crispa FD-325 SS-3]|nr:hypothetical protein PLICRDRAFT_173852 [Plicaturopsis crispa FD-325 SS-3]
MSHIRPLTDAHLAPPTPTFEHAQILSEQIEFSTFGSIQPDPPSYFDTDPDPVSPSRSFSTRLVNFLAPAASLIVPVLHIIMLKPSPHPRPSTEIAQPRPLGRIWARMMHIAHRPSPPLNSDTTQIPLGNPSLWSSATAQPPHIWVSHTVFREPSHESIRTSRDRYITTFRAVETLHHHHVLIAGVDTYGQTIGIGDPVRNPSESCWTNPGLIVKIYALTRNYVVFCWNVERLGSKGPEEELLAVPIHYARLGWLNRARYRYAPWSLPQQTFTPVIVQHKSARPSV